MGFWKTLRSALNFIPVVGPLIEGAVSLIGGSMSNNAQKSANEANLSAVEKANQANRELARYNWEQQKEMWHQNNLYNSPIQQMHRLNEAGLNPNLVYGNGVTGNTSSTIPTPQLPTMQAGHVEPLDYGYLGQAADSAFRTYMQQKQVDSQISLQKSQESAIQSQNLVNNAKIAEIMTRNARGKFDLDLAKDLRQNSIEAALLSTSQMKQKLQIGEEELKNFPIQRAKMKTEISLLEANRNLSVKQAEKISFEIWKISEEIVNFGFQRGLWQSQTRLNNENASYLEDTHSYRVSQVAQALTNACVDGDIKKLKLKLDSLYHGAQGELSGLLRTTFGPLSSMVDGLIKLAE